MLEFYIWGIKPKEKYEDILYSKCKNKAECLKVIEILEKKYKCKNLRIQQIDISKPLDLKEEFSRSVLK